MIGNDEPKWSAYEDLQPEGSLPVFGFRVVAYIRPDGTPGIDWSYSCGGEVQNAFAVGVIEGAKLELFHGEIHEHLDED